MVECSRWTEWVRAAWRGQFIPLQHCTATARVQLVFAAALTAALLDTAASWIGWSSMVLREQYAALNALVAERMGYQPPAAPTFSALGVFSSSLFVGTVSSLLLWGLVGLVVVRLVIRQPVSVGAIATAAVLPLPVSSLVGVLSVCMQLLAGSARVVPSLGAFLDPVHADIRLFSIASKIELSGLVYALVMMRVLLASERWSIVAIGSGVAFVLRCALVAGGVLLVAALSGLPTS